MMILGHWLNFLKVRTRITSILDLICVLGILSSFHGKGLLGDKIILIKGCLGKEVLLREDCW